MKKAEITKIAEAWIQMSQSERGSVTYDKNFWAAERMFDLVSNAPEDAWLIIDMIRHKITPLDKVFWHLAASHLEDLLVEHGELFIERFENLAKNDVEFRKLLGGVWQNKISESIWKRIQAIAIPGPL